MNSTIVFLEKQITIFKVLILAHKYNNNIKLLYENKKDKLTFKFLKCIIFDCFLVPQNVCSQVISILYTILIILTLHLIKII